MPECSFQLLQINSVCVCVCVSVLVGRVHPLLLSAGVSLHHIRDHGLFLHLHWPDQDRSPVCQYGAWRAGEEEEFGDGQEGLSWALQGRQKEFWLQLRRGRNQTVQHVKLPLSTASPSFYTNATWLGVSCRTVPVQISSCRLVILSVQSSALLYM